MIEAGTITVTDGISGVYSEPITLEDIKVFAMIDEDDTSLDQLIDDLIISVRETVESLSNMALTDKTITFNMGDSYSAFLPYANGAVTITSVEDTDNVETLTATEYRVKGKVLNIDYKGNYGITYTLSAVVPASLKEAVKMLVVYRLRNRGDQEAQHGIPEDILSVIKGKRVVWL